MWLINLGCIDLNPWYARQDDYNRPDFLHFDLDPTPGAEFSHMRDAALAVHDIIEIHTRCQILRRLLVLAAFIYMFQSSGIQFKSMFGLWQKQWRKFLRTCIRNY